MWALYIALGVAALIILLLVIPAEAYIKYSSGLSFKLSYFGITVFRWRAKPKKNGKAEHKKAKKPDAEKKKSLISQYGFTGAVKRVCGGIREILTETRQFLSHMTVTGLDVNISVTGSNAAVTAIEYGAVCAAVYPTVGAFSALVGASGIKNITVKADYGGKKSVADFAFKVKCRPVWIIKAALSVSKILANKGITGNEKPKDAGGSKNGRK